MFDLFTGLTIQQLIDRDQVHQREVEDAGWLAVLPWLVLSLVVSLGIGWLIWVVRDWWGRRQP